MLRACYEASDYYEFQRHLFEAVYRVEERRAQCSRVLKRLRRGKSLPTGLPPPHEGDPHSVENWELEAYVFERLARQLRTVGDGLAWRCYGYDRRVILALSRNESAGPMFGKKGLGFELGRVEELWKTKGNFALLHDLTNCLRIADLTEFDANGAWLREVKSTPRTDKAQINRMQVAIDALMHGGSLPGFTSAHFVELSEVYDTNLRQLDDAIQLAKKHGARGMRLPLGRTLVAMSLIQSQRRWHDNPAEGARVMESVRQQAIKRAGIANSVHHVKGNSGDLASRSPVMAPWSIYPLTAEECAQIICDLLVFETLIPAETLVGCLERVGLGAEVVLPPVSGALTPNQDVLRVRWRNRTLTLHNPGLSILLFELVKPDVWARGMLEAISLPDPPESPVLVFAREADVWLARKDAARSVDALR